MGIYDRDYYRRNQRGFLDSFSGNGQVCKWLIIINVVVFFLQILTQNEVGGGIITDSLLLDPKLVISGQVWRLLTCAFLHAPGSIWHILFNMLFLWWFGHALEEMHGSREFLVFYLTSAIFSSVVYSVLSLILQDNSVALGASGAVYAVTVLYALHFPRRTILLFFIIPVPIWALLGFYLIGDLFVFAHQLNPRGGVSSNVAVTAHLGGALFGFLYFRFSWRLSQLFQFNFQMKTRRRTRPRLRVYQGADQPGESHSPITARSDIDEQLEAKVDAVLEKIKKTGQESLTESEKKILFQASEIYQKRRSPGDE